MIKIMEMEVNLINNGENIESTVMYEGDYANIIKGAALGIAELTRLIAEETDESITREDVYELIKEYIDDIIYPAVG